MEDEFKRAIVEEECDNTFTVCDVCDNRGYVPNSDVQCTSCEFWEIKKDYDKVMLDTVSSVDRLLNMNHNTIGSEPWRTVNPNLYQPIYTWTTNGGDMENSLLNINKCENGFKVKFDNKEYVFESLDGLLTFVKNKLSEENKP